MAAESPEDKDVDALIADVQSALDKLKAAQRKDVDDEEPSKAKNLQGAERDAFKRLRSARDQADEKSEK